MVLEHWLFDIVIFSFIIVDALALVILFKKNKKLKEYLLIFCLFFAGLVVFYGSFIEPRIIITRDYDIDLGGDTRLKAIVLGDFHLGPYNNDALVAKVVERVNERAPDIVFLVGDYISLDNADAKNFYPLANLHSRLGVFAVTGNHDYTGGGIDELVEEIEKYGVNFLRNRGVRITFQEREIFIVGVDDYWYGDLDSSAALEEAREQETVFLLAHNPDAVKFIGKDELFDLMLSGHTHGGQIRLPIIGPVPPLPTDLPRTYDRGLKEWNGRKIFITSGLGEIGPRARLFNFPEISVLNINF